MKPNEKIRVGCWTLGQEHVELYGVRGQEGGSFFFLIDGGQLAHIEVGLGQGCWAQVAMWLVHETWEFLATRAGRAYWVSNGLVRDSQSRVFMLNHTEAREICAAQTSFLIEALPALAKVWEKTRG